MYHSGIEAPQGVWWKPLHGGEKIWVTIAFAWCLVLFAMMPLWHLRGGQNPSGIRYRVEPRAYAARVAVPAAKSGGRFTNSPRGTDFRGRSVAGALHEAFRIALARRLH